MDPEFAGLPLLRLAPLSPPDAAALLDDIAQDGLKTLGCATRSQPRRRAIRPSCCACSTA
ncbi:hypothetical protein [Streptomyces canarius]